MSIALLVSLLLWGLACPGCRPLLRSTPWDLNTLADGEDDHPPEDESPSTTEPSEDEAASAAAKPAKTASAPGPLTHADWILRVPPPGEQLASNDFRWRHVALEELLSQPADKRPDVGQWLDDQSAIVRANAAIAVARQSVERAADLPAEETERVQEIVAVLDEAVRNSDLKLPQRRAAIEALGHLSGAAARASVAGLVEQYGDFAGPRRGTYHAELHTELLGAWARLSGEAAIESLALALTCRDAGVRWEALRVWPLTAQSQLPDTMLELAQDPDPRVRGECLKLLARGRHPQAFTRAQRAVNDLKFEVRLEAIAALGMIETAEAQAELERLRKHPTEGLRAAAVKALAAREAWDAILPAADDESWQVRLALAETLHAVSTPAANRAAEKLMRDRSTDVQQRAVLAIAQWPWPRGGELLLAALDSRIYHTRETAAKKLGEAWAPAANFPYQGDAEARVAAIVALREKWEAEFPASASAGEAAPSATLAIDWPTERRPIRAETRQQVAAEIRLLNAADSGGAAKAAACERLLALGDELSPALAELIKIKQATLPPEVYAQVLPKLDPRFALLARLEFPEPHARRQTASELRQTASETPLSELALLRLVELVVSESDPVVWHETQELLARDMREPVVRLQYAGLNHPVAEVQRRACVYLGEHGEARHASVLAAALEDKNPQVVRAAAEACGELDRLENTLPLVRLLASRDRELVLVVSTSLAKHGEESGGDGLERLAQDVDPKIRRRAIQAMAELRRPRFIGAYIRALDDQLGIKQMALQALIATVGQDLAAADGATKLSLAEQITLWKQWHAKQEQARLRGQR